MIAKHPDAPLHEIPEGPPEQPCRIAVGEVMRSLTSKAYARHPSVQTKAADLFQHLQVGISVRGGCEAVVHAVRSTLYDSDLPDEVNILLQLDVENAFNTFDRSHLFR